MGSGAARRENREPVNLSCFNPDRKGISQLKMRLRGRLCRAPQRFAGGHWPSLPSVGTRARVGAPAPNRVRGPQWVRKVPGSPRWPHIARIGRVLRRVLERERIARPTREAGKPGGLGVVPPRVGRDGFRSDWEWAERSVDDQGRMGLASRSSLKDQAATCCGSWSTGASTFSAFPWALGSMRI